MSNDFKIEQMEAEVEEMTALRYLNKDNAIFEKTPGGFVSLTFEGKNGDGVQVIRLFPFTEPNKFISIRTVEERSKEIGVIEDMKNVCDFYEKNGYNLTNSPNKFPRMEKTLKKKFEGNRKKKRLTVLVKMCTIKL